MRLIGLAVVLAVASLLPRPRAVPPRRVERALLLRRADESAATDVGTSVRLYFARPPSCGCPRGSASWCSETSHHDRPAHTTASSLGSPVPCAGAGCRHARRLRERLVRV